MDVDECIQERRSIRKFSGADVEWEKIGEIIKAGKAAPSAGNLQNFKFVLVMDKDKKKALAEACLQQHWIASAPIIIIVCSEPEKSKKFYGIRGERLYSIQNAAAAAQNILLRAHSLGLGTCWVGAFEEEMVKRVISLGAQARPQVVIPIGYPDEEPPVPQKYTLENMTYFEKWASRKRWPEIYVGKFGVANKKTFEKMKSSWEDKKENMRKKGSSILDKVVEKVTGKKPE